MVIIKDYTHTQRHAAKSKKAFSGVLAIVLVLLMATSAFLAAIPTVSAKGESAFTDNECIYIDCSQSLDGNHWDDSGAELRVFTYYNDSDGQHFCHEFEEDFQNDNWFTGSNVLQKGIKADKFSDHIYRFRIPSDKISHVRIARTNSGATSKWNLSPYMWDNRRTKTAGSKSNCIRITGWDSSATWTSFAPANNASFNSKSAQPDSTITGNSNLYTIDAKFYDYYNDDEIQKGWQNINSESNHASVHYTKNGDWYWWAGYWEPFSYLNSKIADQANSNSDVIYPMYFGNFYGKSDGYTGEGQSNLKKFNNMVNNSNNIGGDHKSVAGLTGGTLKDGKDLVYSKANGYNSDTLVPFFDENFLSSNKVGSVVNSKFPMRKVVNNGITTYAFDSTSGQDNVWINNSTGSNPTVSYGAGTSYGAKDSLYSYSDRQASGYGFFPFDSTRGTNAEAKNYGFGMRVDVKFNLGADSSDHIGQIKGTNGSYVDQVFSFTGDDDVWVYVDGKLILDLGGDHKQTSGSINFHTKKVTANTGATFNGATRNQDFSLDNYGDPTAEHTLTMFYVERGMIESNLSFNFNFSPVGNELIVDKTVDTTNINDGLQSAVAAADTFSFNQPTAAGKTSSKGVIGSNGTYTLKDGESISFKNQFTRGQSMTVTESESSPLDYTTTWTAKDLVKNESRGSGSTKTANFTYNTSDTSQFAMTRVQLSYVNTPSVGSVSVTKTLEGGGNEEFDATVSVSLDGGNTYENYPLVYTATDVTGTKQLGTNGKLSSDAKLKNGRTLTFSNLPVGAKVRVVENISSKQGASYKFKSVSGSEVSNLANGGEVTVDSGNKAMTITNSKKSGGAQLSATKTLGGSNYTGEMFWFTLQGLPEISGMNNIDTEDVTEFVNGITDGSITFDLDNLSVGTYCYVLYEEDLNTGNTQVDKEISINSNKQYYLVKVVMAESGGVLKPTVTYYSAGQTIIGENIFTGLWEFNVDKNDFADGKKITGTPVFENEIKKPYIKINKVDQTQAAVTATAKFAVYKVPNNGADLETGTLVDEKETVNGSVRFDNLDLYKDGYQRATKASDLKYQWYAVVETQAPGGHMPTGEVYYVQFPIQGTSALTYHAVYDYQNGKLVNPETAGSGNGIFKTVGWSVAGFAVFMLAAYVLMSNKSKKRAKHFNK